MNEVSVRFLAVIHPSYRLNFPQKSILDLGFSADGDVFPMIFGFDPEQLQ